MNYKEIVETANHYDMVIDEGNDPVYDPEELQAYMDKWDGAEFIEAMSLDKSKSVLETESLREELQSRPRLCVRTFAVLISHPKQLPKQKIILNSLTIRISFAAIF